MRLVDLFFSDAGLCVHSAFPSTAGYMVLLLQILYQLSVIKRALLFSLRIHLKEFPGRRLQDRLLAHSFMFTGEQKT